MISQEQIAVAAQKNTIDRHNGTKFIHLKKDDLLNSEVTFERGVFLSLDGVTFNGKDHLSGVIPALANQSKKERNIKFDAMTVAYRPSNDGERLDVALTFKSHKDVYIKRVGAGMTNIALLEHQKTGEVRFNEVMESEHFNGIYLLSIGKETILRLIGQHDKITSVLHTTKNVEIDDIRTYELLRFLKTTILELIENIGVQILALE